MSSFTSDKPRSGPLLLIFLRLANLTFGGGAPTVGALQRELVDRRKWLTPEDFGLSYALSRITPGTNLYAFCTASAWLLLGTRTAILTLVVSSLPCCILVWLTTAGFDRIQSNPWTQHAVLGAMAGSVSVLFASFWTITRPYIVKRVWIRNCTILALSILLSFWLRLSPLLVLAISACIGWLWPEPEKATV